MTDFIFDLAKVGEVYVVGGAVRDYIYNYYHGTNKIIKDFDFLVRLIRKENIINVLKKFGSCKEVEVGKSFDIILFTPFSGNTAYEFVTPINGYMAELSDDFARRDSTMNAMGFRIYSLQDLEYFKHFDKLLVSNIYDFFGGCEDIKRKIWRCVGNPIDRFYEDPTRVMRAFRQSAELNLQIDNQTFNELKNHYSVIQKLIPDSFVRLYNELLRTINSKYYKNHLDMMRDIGILELLKINKIYTIYDTNSTILKLAMLIRPETFASSIRTWINETQLNATVYLNKHDSLILEGIQKYSDVLSQINLQLYDILKILESMYKDYKTHTYFVIENIMIYLNLINCTKKYSSTIILINESKKYPITTDDLVLDGHILMQKYNITGQNIKKTKDMLLDEIHKNNCSNKLDELEKKLIL